jgi:hypothetical protein
LCSRKLLHSIMMSAQVCCVLEAASWQCTMHVH